MNEGIKGLVLAGGDSSRMGVDKGLIDYHGMPQREYLRSMLATLVDEVLISCRPGQITDSNLPLLEDRYFHLGPFGAVLTAFEYDAGCAWLLIGCDFPLLDRNALMQLLEERDQDVLATCFLDPRSGLPEPWITLLEPGIFPIIQDYYKQGKSSMRGILQDSKVKLVVPKNPDILLNANTPQEALRLREKIKFLRKN